MTDKTCMDCVYFYGFESLSEYERDHLGKGREDWGQCHAAGWFMDPRDETHRAGVGEFTTSFFVGPQFCCNQFESEHDER